VQRRLKLLFCSFCALVLWAPPARAAAPSPYIVYVGFGGNQLAERARDFLEERLAIFSRWMGASSRIHGFPGFDVRPLSSRGPLRGQALAIVDGRIGGQEQNEPQATVDIATLPSLSLLENPASRFRPVRGVVRVGARGNLSTSMGMYESIILYSLLVRAFEQRQPRLFGFVNAQLTDTIQRSRRELGYRLSFLCLRTIERNAARMRDDFSNSAARARATQLPQKELIC
jgi:hypothetical protein